MEVAEECKILSRETQFLKLWRSDYNCAEQAPQDDDVEYMYLEYSPPMDVGERDIEQTFHSIEVGFSSGIVKDHWVPCVVNFINERKGDRKMSRALKSEL